VTFRGAQNAKTGESQLPKVLPNGLQASLIVCKRNGGIYRLIFRVSALPGQLSVFERTRLVHEFRPLIGTSAFECKNVRSSALPSELALTCEIQNCRSLS
jgi:hypothetical protein